MSTFVRLCLSLLAFALLPVSLVQAQTPAAQISELSEEQLQAWTEKLNGYTKLLNGSLRAASSWSRYRSWVNVKTGPTGKERIIYGLYSVNMSLAQDALKAGREALQNEPRLAALDAAAQRYADSFEALVPIVNEAEGYYSRKDYKDDKMAKGKELHAKLVPLFTAFSKDRETVEQEMKAVKTAVDMKQLTFIEQREGKSYAWHKRRVMMTAAEAADVLSENGPDQLARLDKAIPPFAAAVKDFDDYLASPDAKKGGSLDSFPRSFLGNLRDYRDELESNPDSADMKLQFLINEYNMLVQMAN